MRKVNVVVGGCRGQTPLLACKFAFTSYELVNYGLTEIYPHNLEELVAECSMESMEKAVAAALK